jgi:DNA-binding NtrC family response regulator
MHYKLRMHIVLDNYNLTAAERLLCETALTAAGSIVEAAKLLGITRHALKRRIIKHNIRRTREGGRIAAGPDSTRAAITAAPSVGAIA